MSPIIDVHCHLGEWLFPVRSHGKAETLRLMQDCGITLGIFSSAKAVLYDFREGNRELAEALVGEPRMRGYVTINPNYPEESRRELDAYLGRPEFVGIKCHANCTGQSPTSPTFRRLLPHLAELGRPIKYHANFTDVAAVAREYPQLKFLVPHQHFLDFVPDQAPPPNVYADICGTPSDRDKVRVVVQALGADHVLFASDMTLISPSMILGMVEESDLSKEDKERVYYRNAAQLFGLQV